MINLFEFIATLSAALFCGAAIYINVAEHPARMTCETKIAATQWAPSYKRATVMQASLAVAGFICGVVVWLLGGTIWWLGGALFIVSVVPFTFIAIMPTNNRLLEPGRDLGSDKTRALLNKWGRLHAMRSVLSLVASVIYVGLLAGPSLIGRQRPYSELTESGRSMALSAHSGHRLCLKTDSRVSQVETPRRSSVMRLTTLRPPNG